MFWASVLLGVTGLELVAIGANPGTTASPVVIRVYNTANVEPENLLGAEQVVTRILAGAGIPTEWRSGDQSDPEAHFLDYTDSPAPTCHEPLKSRELTLEIEETAPGWMPKTLLGRSLPCARRGILAMVFQDRISSVVEHNGISYDRVLGHAIAHEIGHVLLQSDTHAAFGLMRGIWTARDWQRAAVSDVGFSPQEAAQIRASLEKAGTTPSAGRLPPAGKQAGPR
jgi:hypothetical protein